MIRISKRIFVLLLILVSSVAYGQLHEILVTDTSQVVTSLSEDSVTYFSFRNTKNLKGHWTVYYDKDNQHKAMEAEFKKGKPVGSEKQWYESGQLLSEKNCVHDTCTADYYYENGILMRREMVAVDAIKGTSNKFYSATYCDNGQIKNSPPLNPGSSEPQFITSFYCSGKKEKEYTLMLVAGKHVYTGPYTEWYENGVMKCQGYYESKPDAAGEKTGFWNYYNTEGKFTLQERYENGKVIDSLKY